MEAYIKRITRRTQLFFFPSVVVLLVVGLLVYLGVIPRTQVISIKAGDTLQSIFLILLLCLIPLIMSLFNRAMVKWNTLDDPKARLDRYARASTLRLIGFDVLSVMVLLLTIFTNIKSVGYLYGILLFFYILIFPSKPRVLTGTMLKPDGTIRTEEDEKVAEVEPVETVSEESDDDDDFIPRNPKPGDSDYEA